MRSSTGFLRRGSLSLSLTLLSVGLLAPLVMGQEMPSLSAPLQALNPTGVLPSNAEQAAKLQFFKTLPKFPLLAKDSVTSTVRVETFSKAEQPWAVEISIPTTSPLATDEVCLARFQMRALKARQESQEGIVNCYFQQTSTPFDKTFQLPLSVGAEWKTFEIPFKAKSDTAPGTSALYFSFGELEQTIEIKNVQVLNFGTRASISQLPSTRFSYRGREAGAVWRTKALERIEQIRTAPMTLRVQDTMGKPLSDARVQVRLVQPDFAFGSAVNAGLIPATSPDARMYRDKIAELFDTVTIENDLKWPSWVVPNRRALALSSLEWLQSKGLRIRGHNLVWPSFAKGFSPDYLKDFPNLGVNLEPQIEAHIEDVVTATQGKIWQWDVLNEPVHERDYFKFVPETQAAEWFKQARRLNPEAKLFVNEYAMLNGRRSPEFIAQYLDYIKSLQANGAPLDGIGVQGHVGQQVRNPEDVLTDLDLLQKAGLPITITEFDINTTDEALQADYMRDFLIACYSHPAVSGFIMWGFWEGNQWKSDAALFRKDWSEKPNAKVWREWVLNTWRTHFEANTNAQGTVAGRGHLGIYEISVTPANKPNNAYVFHTHLTQGHGDILLTIN